MPFSIHCGAQLHERRSAGSLISDGGESGEIAIAVHELQTPLNFRILLLSLERKIKRVFAEAGERLPAEIVLMDTMAHAELAILRDRFEAIFADAEFPGISRAGLAKVLEDSQPNRRTASYLMTGYAPLRGSDYLQHEGLIILGKPSSCDDLMPLLLHLKGRLATERRRAGRLRFEEDVQFLQAGRHFRGTSLNLSMRGMLIATEIPFERGSQFEIRFLLPGSEAIFQVRVRVARIVATRLVGVTFENLAPFDRQRLETFMNQRLSAKTPPPAR